MLLKAINNLRLTDEDNVIRKLSSEEWEAATQAFWTALDAETDSSVLEAAVFHKYSWDLPIDARFALLDRAKGSGVSSFEFLRDYYRFRALYLEPDDPEREFSTEMTNGKYN